MAEQLAPASSTAQLNPWAEINVTKSLPLAAVFIFRGVILLYFPIRGSDASQTAQVLGGATLALLSLTPTSAFEAQGKRT